MKADALTAELEQRLRQRTIGAQHLAAHDQSRSGTPRALHRLTCSPDLPSPLSQLLLHMIPELLGHAEEQGFTLRHLYYSVTFHTAESFFHTQGRAVPEKLKLPTVMFRPATDRPGSVNVLLPAVLKSTESLLESIRRILTRLVAQQFLEESVLPLEFYRTSVVSSRDQVTTGPEEILGLIAALEFPSPTLESLPPETSGSPFPGLRMSPRQQQAQAWRKRLNSEPEPNETLLESLELIWGEFLAEFELQPEKWKQSLVEEAWKLDAQNHLLWPQERLDFQRLAEQRPEHFLRSLGVRLTELGALAEFLLEVHESAESLEAPELQSALTEQVLGKMHELQRSEKAWPHLIPGVLEESAQRRAEQRFKLWLVKLAQARNVPGKEWQKWTRRAQKTCEQAFSQKIYEGLLRLRRFLQQKQEQPETPLPQELSKLQHALRFRLSRLQEWQAALGVMADLSEADTSRTRQHFPLEAFLRAWTHTLSASLILSYFEAHPEEQTFLNQRFQPQRYRTWLGQDALRRVESGQLVFLLVLLFLKVEERLEPGELPGFLRELALEPRNSLRFTLHQVIQPFPEDPKYGLEYRLKKLDNYADALVQAHLKRLQEKIPE